MPAYGTQVHHAALDWTDGGETNVNDNGLACGCDNRMVGPEGWTTRINEQHEVEWIPPPHLDTGQTRINDYHQPEKLRPPPADAWTPPTPDDNRAGDEPTAFDDALIPDHRTAHEESVTNDGNGTHESSDPDPPGDQDYGRNDPPAGAESATNHGDKSVSNDPPTTDGSATYDGNRTRESSDSDPPDGKAA